MFKFAAIIFSLAIVTVVDAAPPTLDKYPSLNWVNTNVVHNPFGPTAVKPMVLNPPSMSAATNVEEWESPIIQKAGPAASMMTWIPLDSWAAQQGIGKPHLLSTLPVTSYALGSSNGTMVLTIGSHGATWNGVEVHLGFEPQIIDGQISLYGLDLEKNLKPLLCDPPLALPQTNGVIVIDPGHGGSNVGTHSVLDGRFEKEFTLDWALRLAPLLKAEGWRVFLTRDSDVYVTNANRVTFAEKHHADLFISLHFNSLAPDQKPSGIETYCLTPVGLPSTLTRGYADPWSASFPDNAFDVKNLQLAVRMQGALVRDTGMDDRGVCRARFMEVLRGQRCPAVLIEAGFLSNPGDARQIETAAFQQKLAQAVADALRPKPAAGSQKPETLDPGTNQLSRP